MKSTAGRNSRSNRNLSTLVAVGGGLAAFPAAALELGDVTVQSNLGQPLRASIAFALAPSERISDNCVTLRPGRSLSGLPAIGNAAISVSNGVIMLRGSTVLREPMVSAHVVINCPYSANLSREYMLFVDPATPAYEQTAVTQQATPDTAPVAVTPAVSTPAVTAAPVARTPATRTPAPVQKDIAKSTRYQVQPGDTAGDIARRIDNRGVGLWAAVDAIFTANPDAFMNNDPNQLKAGSWLSIPSFIGTAPIVAATAETAIETVTETAQPTATAETETAPISATAGIVDTAAVAPDLQAGVVVLDDNPFVEPAAGTESVVIGDTSLQGPTTASTSPNVPTAIISSNNVASDSDTSPKWLWWLAGSGIAVILGLLMFGRLLRGRPSEPALESAAVQPRRRITDTEKTDTESVAALGVDYDLTDESPTEENLALDADLIIGTGLEDGAAAETAHDFGFGVSNDVDIELPFEPLPAHSDDTEMLSPLKTDEHSILDSEVLPEDGDDYDMSVIIDATKIPLPEDITERDLKAVKVTEENGTLVAQNYTINQEIDYEILEQDYEDEMTATQALNQEIARAAVELAERIDVDAPDDGDETTALPLATVTELDITAQMPAKQDAVSDLDDTGINQAIEETAEMPKESGKAG